jgi:calcium-dependent protein kinase
MVNVSIIEEYVMASVKKHRLITKEKILAIFKEVDSDGNGMLCFAEVRKMLIKINIPHHQVKEVIRELDTNNDGQISQEEFIEAMMSMKHHIKVKMPTSSPTKN